MYKRNKATPVLGTYHGSDLSYLYASEPTDFIGTDALGTTLSVSKQDHTHRSALVSFVNNLDPRTSNPLSLLAGVNWAPWSSNVTAPPMLAFVDPSPDITVIADTYRADAMDLLMQAAEESPVTI